MPAGATASGSVYASAIADIEGYAFAEAAIWGPNVQALAYADAEEGSDSSETDSFSNGPSGTYTLELIYEADAIYGAANDTSSASATATLSWQ